MARNRSLLPGIWQLVQLAMIASVAVLLFVDNTETKSEPVRTAPTLQETATAVTLAALHGDAATARKSLIEMPGSAQQVAFEQWMTALLEHCVRTRPVQGDVGLSVNIEKQGPPITWVEVHFRWMNRDDVVILEAWRQEANGAWRFDCVATMERLPDEIKEPKLPPLPPASGPFL